MTFQWITASFSFYVVNFYLKYLKGSMMANSFIADVVHIAFLALGGFIYVNLGLKTSLLVNYTIAIAGAVLLACFEDAYPKLIPVFVLLTKGGTMAVFGTVYVANEIFPIKYGSQTIGYCNTIARFRTMFAPLIGEV